MRIICPSCAAEYEVDDAAIPPEGRDVQCSNCGRAWFQLPNTPIAGAGQKPAAAGAERREDASGAIRAAAAPPAAAPAMAEPERPAPRPEPAAEEPAPVPRPSLDEALREVLRAEAEREAAARRAEAAALETQPELGLTRAPAPRPEVRPETRPEARPELRADGRSVPVPERPVPRKRLPDIEEVDPVLGPKLGALPVPVQPAAEGRGNFRTGFLLVLGVALVLLLVYIYGRAQPQAGPVLSSYVALVDDTRLMLSTRLEALVRRLTEMMGGR